MLAPKVSIDWIIVLALISEEEGKSTLLCLEVRLSFVSFFRW